MIIKGYIPLDPNGIEIKRRKTHLLQSLAKPASSLLQAQKLYCAWTRILYVSLTISGPELGMAREEIGFTIKSYLLTWYNFQSPPNMYFESLISKYVTLQSLVYCN
jgi:hypothetical protein